MTHFCGVPPDICIKANWILIQCYVLLRCTVEIKKTKNKAPFSSFGKSLDFVSSSLLYQWVQEDYACEAYYATNNNKTVGFALLRKTDFDPYGVHSDPWVTNLVWVLPSARRRGVGVNFWKQSFVINKLHPFVTTKHQ